MSSKKHAFITTDGTELELRPISVAILNRISQDIETKYRERGEPLDPPTYTIETAGGGEEIHIHTEETTDTPEEKAALAAHQDAQERLSAEQNDKSLRYMVIKGVASNPPADWLEDAEYFGIDLPDDPRERKWIWIEEVLKTAGDAQKFATHLMTLSATGGIEEEDLRAVEATFRSATQEAGSIANSLGAIADNSAK